jgi:hypothetical protein
MNTHKQITRIAAVLAASFFAGAVAVHAETVVAKVPFEFTMGDQKFPAGRYEFEVDRLSPSTVLVRALDAATTASCCRIASSNRSAREPRPFRSTATASKSTFP